MIIRPSTDELRGYLAGRPPAELIADLIALYADDDLVRDFYTLRLRPGFDQELLARARAQISNEFLPDHGGGGRPEVTQEVLRAYRRRVAAPEGNAELMLHAVEAGTAFGSDYGGVDGPLAAWLADTFEGALTLLQEQEGLAPQRDRCLQIVRASAGAGWGLAESMEEIFDRFFPLDAEAWL